MKVVLLASLVFLSAFNALAQGTVIWSPPTEPITTNGLGNAGPISGTNTYRFGFYVGAAGSSADSLSLVALAWNDPLVPGRTEGGSGPVLLPGFANGTTIAFQVRGWSSFAGTGYNEALNYALAGNEPIAFLGQTPLGTYVVGSPFPLRWDAFVLSPIPEPSTWALGTLGLVTLTLLQRKRVRASLR